MMKTISSLRRAVETTTYASAVAGASMVLISAAVAADLTWFTRVMILFVAGNGVIHTTSFLLEKANRTHPNDCERGPSASHLPSTAVHGDSTNPPDDEDVSPASTATFAAEPETTPEKEAFRSVFSTAADRDEDIASEAQPSLHCSQQSYPDSEPEFPPETKQEASDHSEQLHGNRAIVVHPAFQNKPTSRVAFRPLSQEDSTSVLARSKRF
jgi:hypothetical protein